jgi:hypothetical protein
MKYRHLLPIAMMLVPLGMRAEDVRTLYLTTAFQTANRTPLQTLLPQATGTDRGPVIDFTAKKAKINGLQVSLGSIKSLAFDIRVIDGIGAPASSCDGQTDSKVYTIDGRLVRRHAGNLDTLPKGIYIVNGKKHIVK